MKNNFKSIIIFTCILLILIFSGILFFLNYINTNNTKDIQNTSVQDEYSISHNSNNEDTISSEENTTDFEKTNINLDIESETTLASFSTTIHNKEPGRQNNIQIVINTFNNYIIKSGEIFSFTNINGPATSEKGYQESDIFDENGNKARGLGGGICQVSTTIYNAALQIPGLEIVERHPHSSDVPYIEKGYDAAVAYGSMDLKFKNNTNSDIRLSINSTESEITVSLISLN